MADSGFDSFDRDYYAENWIDNKSWAKRKVYDTTPYLILPSQKFNIKLHNLLPNFYCYIRAGAEQFGDRIAFPLSGYEVNFYLYDEGNNLVLKDAAEISNLKLGEIRYSWKPLDIQEKGIYVCELEFIETSSGKTFRLPDTQNRFEIIVT